MTLKLQLPLLLLLLSCTGGFGSATQPKQHQHFFQPNLGTALDGIKSSLYGKDNGLQNLYSQVEKNQVTMDLLKFKIDRIKNWLKDFYSNPYECDVPDTEFFGKYRMCYLLEVREKKSFPDAQQDCLKRGGTLFQPLDPDDSDLITFISNLEDGFLSRSNNDIWIGATAVAVTGQTDSDVTFLNGVPFPDDTKFWVSGSFPTIPGRVVLRVAVGPNNANLKFKVRRNENAQRGYICEFMAWLKDPDIDFMGKEYQAQFQDTGFNHQDVENPHNVPSKRCESIGQFLINDKCYKYFDMERFFMVARDTCMDDGGRLAKPSLLPYSRFGAVLADEISDNVDAGTEIWIHAKLEKHGADRLVSELQRMYKENVTLSGDTNKKRAVSEKVLRRAKNTKLQLRDDNNLNPDTYVIILPISTPVDFFDDTEWSIDLVDNTEKHSFLCEYEPVH